MRSADARPRVQVERQGELRPGDDAAGATLDAAGHLDAAAHDRDAIEVDVELRRIEHRPAVAGGADDATPVRIAAVERALAQRRARDRVGHLGGIARRARAAHPDVHHLGRALAVLHDRARQSAPQTADGAGERRVGSRADADRRIAGGAVREQQDRVVGAHVAVDDDGVEGLRQAGAATPCAGRRA